MSVKEEIIARVMGREYVPTRTVELKPDETVVPQLQTGWWKSSSAAEAALDTNNYDLREADTVTVASTCNCLLSSQPCRVHDDIESSSTSNLPPDAGSYQDQQLSAADLGAGEYALFKEFATGGIVTDFKPVIVGEQVSDHVLPRLTVAELEAAGGIDRYTSNGHDYPLLVAMNFSVRPPTATIITAPEPKPTTPVQEAEQWAREAQFATDCALALQESLESVISPDIRVLRFDAPPCVSLNSLISRADRLATGSLNHNEVREMFGLPPLGAPDSSEVTIEGEDLSEHSFRFRTDQELLDEDEDQDDFEFKHGPGPYAFTELTTPEPYQFSSKDELLQAFEIGMSVQAFRWVKSELDRVRYNCGVTIEVLKETIKKHLDGSTK